MANDKEIDQASSSVCNLDMDSFTSSQDFSVAVVGYNSTMTFCMIMSTRTLLFKYEPAFAGSEAIKTDEKLSRPTSAALVRWQTWESSISFDSCSVASGSGNGAEQQLSRTKLGRPRMVLNSPSREYNPHHSRSRVSF